MTTSAPVAEAIFSAAVQHHRAGRFSEAAVFYRSVLERAPDHAGTLLNLATLLAAQGEVDQALALYDRLAALQPGDSRIVMARGSLLLREGRHAAAAEAFGKALSLLPDLLQARLGLGAALLALAQYRQAREAFEAALRQDKDCIEAHGLLATTFEKEGDFAAAEPHLRAVLAAKPDWLDGHAHLADVLDKRGRITEAEAHLAAVLRARPEWAAGYCQLGDLQDRRENHSGALRSFRRALALDPDLLAALFGAGKALAARKRLDAAERFLARARELAPNSPETDFHLGNFYFAKADTARAAEHYQRAIEGGLDAPEVQTNLGCLLSAQGDVEGAIAAHRRALALDPDCVSALSNLGNMLLDQHRVVEAAECYRRAVTLDPEFIVGLINFGNALRLQGRYAEAAEVLDHPAVRQSKRVEAYNIRGLVWQGQGRHDEAIAEFEKIIAVQPKSPEALNNLAVSYQSKGHFVEAIRLYRRVVAQDPSKAVAYYNLGGALQVTGRFDESVTAYQMALKIDPGYKAVYPYLSHSFMQQANWRNLDATIAKMLANTEEELAAGTQTSATGFALMTTSASMDLRYRVARNAAQHIAERVADIKRDLAFTYPRRRRKKIRVGYLSPDFRFHSVAVAFRGLLDAYNRDEFEYYGYSLSLTSRDAVTEALRERFHRFTDVHALSHRDAAKRIHDDGIDILVDLAGYTRFARLEILALQPAPIQAHYLGYSSTIGGDFLQYLITDRWQVASGMERYFAEKLVYLPDCFMATTRAEISAEPVTRADCGLPETGVVFADFNSHYKFEPRLWGVWMRLLKRVPDSVLWMLKGTQFSERNLRHEAVARGIDPKRLIFADRTPHPAHLARHRLVDIALDTLHHGGGVTTVDALWAGVPVVTVAGESPPSRNGASLLAAIGLDDLILETVEAYEAKAFALATNPDQLAAIKARLRRNRDTHPLFNTERLARHLEAAYRLMWQRWRDGLPPAAIEVPPQADPGSDPVR